mgnify:CR=1 FL=1
MELTIEQVLQQGVTAHKEGKIEEAERLYRAILQSQPLNPDANHNLGVIAVSVKKADVALPFLKTALEANPKIEQFWLSYVDALIKENQLETAKVVLEQGRKVGLVGNKVDALKAHLTPTTQVNESKLVVQKKSLTLSQKRKKLAEQKKQEKAKKHNLKSISPSEAEIKSLLNNYQTGQYDDAEKLAVSITQEFPKHQFAWKVLGAILTQTGRVGKSLVACQKSVQLAPQDALAHSNLGVTLQELGRLDEAEVSYEKAITLKPDLAETHSNLGLTLQELGRLGEAEASHKQAIVLKPDYAKAHYNLGNTLKEMGRLEDALASYMQAITLKPDFVKVYYNLSITLTKLDRLDEAEASYRQAIVLNPDYVEGHYNLGNMLKELGRLDEAETSYTRVISLKPDFAEAHNNLGGTLKEQGRKDEAEASYRQAIALNPDYAEAHNNLGVTLKKLGRLQEAEASYTQAIVLRPDYVEAIRNRWILLFEKKEFESALRDADLCISKGAIQLDLTSLYALGRIDEIYKRIEHKSKMDSENISIAAFAAFVAESEKKHTAYNFCPNPIDFIKVSNLSFHLEDSNPYITALIEELDKLETSWEPVEKATKIGFQTLKNINLFQNSSGKIAQLKSIIINELEAYYLKFQNEPCSYIQKFPSISNLFGWHVVLKQQGYQSPHIHPGGWLSGVIYLKVVPSLGKDEGAIEFSLNGDRYSKINSPKLMYQPELGSIVFFPSSLHHRTIPFTTDTDRIVVSFDLMP